MKIKLRHRRLKLIGGGWWTCDREAQVLYTSGLGLHIYYLTKEHTMRIGNGITRDELASLTADFAAGRDLPPDFSSLAVNMRQLRAITGWPLWKASWYIYGSGLHRCPFWRDTFQQGRFWYVPLAVLWQHREWVQRA